MEPFNYFSLQPWTIFAKNSILDFWYGFEYTSGVLKMFYHGFNVDTR